MLSGASVKVIQLLQHFEQLSSVFAQAVSVWSTEYGVRGIIGEIIRSVCYFFYINVSNNYFFYANVILWLQITGFNSPVPFLQGDWSEVQWRACQRLRRGQSVCFLHCWARHPCSWINDAQHQCSHHTPGGRGTAYFRMFILLTQHYKCTTMNWKLVSWVLYCTHQLVVIGLCYKVNTY